MRGVCRSAHKDRCRFAGLAEIERDEAAFSVGIGSILASTEILLHCEVGTGGGILGVPCVIITGEKVESIAASRRVFKNDMVCRGENFSEGRTLQVT